MTFDSPRSGTHPNLTPADQQELIDRLRERVKELTLLHQVARLLQEERPWDQSVLAELVRLLPPAWQYPDICEARIECCGLEARTPGFRESAWQQSCSCALAQGGSLRIVVAYREARAEEHEGPFLAEERALIQSIADMLRVHVERRQIELALRRTEAKFASFFQRAPAGILIAQAADGRILEVNQEVERLLGYSREEVIGRTTTEFGVWNSDRERREHIERVRSAGGTLSFELPAKAKDGRVLPLKVSGQIYEIEGESLVLSVFTDLTQQRAAEHAIRASEARLRRVIASPILGFAFAGGDGTLRDANDEYLRIIGYERDELARGEVNWWRLTPPEHENDIPSAIRQLAASGAAKPWETELLRKDGTRVPVLLGVTSIDDSGDDTVTFVFDRTERRDLERQLRQAQKLEAIGRLAAGIAHDFNNVLSSISMSAELMRGELPRDDAKLEYTREITAATERAAALTRQLLAISRQQVLEPRVLSLNDLIGEIERLLRRVLRDDITIVLSCTPELGAIRADASQIQQVLLNLAVNARDAMPGAGKLLIATENSLHSAPVRLATGTLPAGSYVVLSVGDTGTGMDEATRQQLFEPFFTTKPPGEGTGLGLSTALGIVQQSGGGIDVTSELGQGTRFRIFLPRVERPLDPIPATTGSTVVGGRETILLVEDDATLRRMTRKTLTRLGYRVLEASGPAEAHDVAGPFAGQIDLVLTDVVMREKNGRVLAGELVAGRPDLRVLLMSGYSDDAELRRGSLPVGYAFIQKPFSTELLAARLRSVLDSR